MDWSNVLSVIVLIVVIFLAFRVGAFLMKILLGLLAIAIVVWLVAGLFGGTDTPVAAAVAAFAMG